MCALLSFLSIVYLTVVDHRHMTKVCVLSHITHDWDENVADLGEDLEPRKICVILSQGKLS